MTANVIFWLFEAYGYVMIGFVLGKLGRRAWEDQDNVSLTSFLFFPVKHCAGRVGKMTSPFGMAVHDEDGVLYRALMTLFWPIALVANLMAVSLLGPSWILGRRRNRDLRQARRFAELEAENRRLDEEILRLEADDGHGTHRSRVAPISGVEATSDDSGVIVNENLDAEFRAVRRRTMG